MLESEFHINRDILECKFVQNEIIHDILANINRDILECKLTSSVSSRTSCFHINRDILECKFEHPSDLSFDSDRY